MLNGLSLFTGIGGIELALSEWARPVAYCEIERYAAAVLFSRMSDGLIPKAPIFPDVTKLTGRILPDIDIIYGGFPCQDVSAAGLRKGLDGERTGLFREAIRLIRECKPQFVFFENVGGIRKYVSTVRGELEALGYDCRDGFLSAAEIGANHNRNRWWLLGNAKHNGSSSSEKFGSIGKTIFYNEKGQNEASELKGTDSSTMLSRDVTNTRRKPKRAGKDLRSEIQKPGSKNAPDLRKTFSYADSPRLQAPRTEQQTAGFKQCGDMAYLPSEGLEGGERSKPKRTGDGFTGGDWWSVEPDVGRVANGVLPELDLFIFNNERVYETDIKSDIEKADAEINIFNREILRTMWKYREIAKTSPRLYVRELQNIVPDLPQRSAYERGNLGQRLTEDGELSYLWERFFTATEQAEQAMWQERVLEQIWEIKCRETMEKSFRIDRIKGLGNAVVPLQAREAFKILMGIK